jgi:hypothetical protein
MRNSIDFARLLQERCARFARINLARRTNRKCLCTTGSFATGSKYSAKLDCAASIIISFVIFSQYCYSPISGNAGNQSKTDYIQIAIAKQKIRGSSNISNL